MSTQATPSSPPSFRRPWPRKRRIVVCVSLVLLAFLVRLSLNVAFQGLHNGPGQDLGSDHVEYNLLAKNLVRGEGYTLYPVEGPTAFRPPGTPLVLAGIYAIAGEHYAAVRIVFSLLGALTLIPVWLLLRKLAGDPWAALGATVLALYPGHAYYSMHFFSEVPWALLITMAVWLGVTNAERHRPGLWVLQGLLFGFATLIRPIAILMPVIQAAYFGWSAVKKRDASLLGRHIVRFGLQGLLIAAVIAPWALRNARVYDHFIPFSNHGGITLLGCYNERVLTDPALHGRWIAPSELSEYRELQSMDEVAADTLAKERANEFIANHTRDLPKMTLWKLGNLLSPWPGTPNQAFNWAIALSYGVLLPGMAWGLLFGWRRFGSANAALYAPVWAILANVVLLYGDHRFRISIAPLLIVFAVWAVSCWWERWRPATPEG